MGTRRAGASAVIVALVACLTAPAQPPAVPGAPPLPGGPVPAAPVGAGAPAAPAAGAAGGGGAPRNIWSFFMKTPEQKAQCKANFCNSRIGMFINNLLVPAGAATGGLLGPICPPPGMGGPGGAGGPPNPDDLKKSPTSPEGAAAKIKAEEAQAKAKVAAIEFLATVDCRYYPEAEAGLIAGLRAEKNECVRIAAAKALASGCCCSPKVVKALLISVNCSNKDGFPAEASELVRTYAYVALERCLRKCVEEEPEAPPEPPPAAKKAMYEALAPMGSTVDYSSHILLASYYPLQATETPAQIYSEARHALSRGLKISPQTIARLSGPKNLADAVFPAESRPIVSLASLSSLTLPSLPAIPSFAAIRRSAPRTTDTPSWLPPPQPQPLASTPQIAVERADPVATAQPVPPRNDTFAAPTQIPPQSNTRSGRGNLLHIFQDAWKR
jgi:hypothetical protein